MRKKRRKRRNYRPLIAVCCFILLITGIVCAWRFLFGSLTAARTERDGFLNGGRGVNILLLGVDHRADDVGRSDSLVLLTADFDGKKAAVLSIPRDTRVMIEGNGYDKINHAFAFGGAELTVRTLENLLKTPIDYYAAFETKAFVEMVDALGGVELTVERPMHYEDPWDEDGGLVIDFEPGRQHLDGKKAMEYVRYRDTEGDLGRIGRQQNFAREFLAQTSVFDVLKNLPTLLSAADKAIETNLSVGDRCKLATFFAGLDSEKLTSSMLAGRPAYLQQISYWLPDIKVARLQIASTMGIEPTTAFAVAAAEAAADYDEELPAGFSVPDLMGALKTEGNKITAPDKSKGVGKNSAKSDAEQLAQNDAAAVQEIEAKKAAVAKKIDLRREDMLESQVQAAKAAEEKSKNNSSIRVTIVNSSTIDGAGARTAQILKERGFNVETPTTGENFLSHTRIVTSDEEVENFYGMPFQCVIIGGGKKGEAFVNIGADFDLMKSEE